MHWMSKAYEQALLGASSGEVPVGAVLVDANNNLLSSSHNQVMCLANPAAHAEFNVITNAAQSSKTSRLLGSTLYVTLEPCCMCAGLMVHARIKRLVFATRDFKTGAAGSVMNVLKGFPLNHQVQIDEGLMQVECAYLLDNFFTKCRNYISF